MNTQSYLLPVVVLELMLAACTVRSPASQGGTTSAAAQLPAARPAVAASPRAPAWGAYRVVGAAQEDSDLDDAAVYADIEGLIESAAAGKAETVEVHAFATVGWACDCPPLILRYFGSGGPASAYLLPFVPKDAGMLDPDDFRIPGDFRLVGHYEGTTLTLLEWYQRLGRELPAIEEESTSWNTPYPVFVVDGWCYDPPEDIDQARQRPGEGDWTAAADRLLANPAHRCLPS